MEIKEGHFTLNNGIKVPTIALGTWQSKPNEVKQAVITAINAGYRSIDTAELYGNEAEIGEALQEVFAAGTVKREDLFITTKVWNDHRKAEDVRKAAEESIKKLGLDYVDLYLIHTPVAGVANWKEMNIDLHYVPLSETWGAMEKLVDDGLVKSIGISNFNVQLILDLLSYARIKPAVLQVELHPYHPQSELIAFCASQNILVEAYCPLFLGSVPGLEPPKFPNLLTRAEITEIAAKHGKTAAQVLVAWAITRGTRVLPKSVTPSRIEENLVGNTFTLDEEDLAKIASISERGFIYNHWPLMGVPIYS